MHEYRKAARDGAAQKLKNIESGEPHTKVDSSSWSPPAMEKASVQTGMRPVSPRQYKSGGKVHGEHSKKRADRKARKSGGEVMPPVDRLLNRDMKKANDLRDGAKHIGGMKKGGKVKREHHADGNAIPLPPRRPVPLPPRRPADMDGVRLDPAMQAIQDAKAMAAQDAARKAIADKFDAQQQGYQRDLPQNQKHGGTVKDRKHHAKGGAAHPDEAEDKALIRKMVKPEARTGKAHGGEKWIQGAIKHKGSLHRALHVPEGEKIPASKLKKAEHSKNPKLAKKAHLAETLKRMHHADGGEAGRGLYVRQNYPHEVPGADGGRTAKKRGGAIGKGKTNVNIMIHPHSPMGAMGAPAGMPPMGGPAMPPPPPPRPPMPPMGAMGAGAPMAAPMGAVGAGMPPMGAGRPGMPPIGRKSGGKVEHVIDHAAGGGLGRLEKIKAYGLE